MFPKRGFVSVTFQSIDTVLSFDDDDVFLYVQVLRKGDIVTVDGATGEVMVGSVPLVRSTGDADFQQVFVGVSVR